jgi:hypothetical protein
MTHNKVSACLVECTIGSGGEAPGEGKPVIRDDDDDDNISNLLHGAGYLKS